MKNDLRNMLTITQAAAYVGVSRQTIYNWIRTGFLKYRQIGRVKLVSKVALWTAKGAKKRRQRGQDRSW